jgi:antitoxin component YwqK of YwqJK toxin-antitoxin module
MKNDGSFVNGQPDGLWVSWFDGGQKQSEGRYVLGAKNGTWTWWKSDGSIDRVEQWDIGTQVQ